MSMSKKVLKKSSLDEKEGEEDENEIRRNDVLWSNPNELQATDRITRTRQGPGTSGSRRVVHVSSARHPDTSLGAEALSKPRRPPVIIEQRRPGAVSVPGPGIDSEERNEDDGLTIWGGNDEEAAISPRDESTVQIIAQAVDTEEENRILREQDQLRREYDQLRQIVENAPIVTPVAATNSDVENGDENILVNHDNSPRSGDPKCGPRGRRWFTTSAILLIVVVVTVSLVVVLSSEPTPSDPTTTPPTAQPTTPQNPLSKLLSSASSDETALDFSFYGLSGTIPTEISSLTPCPPIPSYHPTYKRPSRPTNSLRLIAPASPT
jgi:hypothetical protein